MRLNLKSCPFCGEKENLDFGLYTGTMRGLDYVNCGNCGAEIRARHTKNGVLAAEKLWNRRTRSAIVKYPRWIPVADGLPLPSDKHWGNSDWVLAFAPEFGIFRLYLNYDDDGLPASWTDDEAYYWGLHQVTHWMPMPPAPTSPNRQKKAIGPDSLRDKMGGKNDPD